MGLEFGALVIAYGVFGCTFSEYNDGTKRSIGGRNFNVDDTLVASAVDQTW